MPEAGNHAGQYIFATRCCKPPGQYLCLRLIQSEPATLVKVTPACRPAILSQKPRIPVRLTAETGAAARWPQVLARKVNDTSDVFRIGVMDDDDDTVITPERSSHGNVVYRSDRFEGYSYTIDVDTP